MDLVVEHLLVEVHRCLSSSFPTRFSGWPTSYAAGMMPPYGAQGELLRIPLLRCWVNKAWSRSNRVRTATQRGGRWPPDRIIWELARGSPREGFGPRDRGYDMESRRLT